jgi:hypothetical protein
MSVSEIVQRIERLEEHCKIEATKVARLWRMHEGMMALQTPIVVQPSPATRLGEAGVRSEAEPWKTYNPLPASLHPTPAPAANGMRTDRVTLEVTREAWRNASLTSHDDWSGAAKEAGIIFLPGESVRVVDDDRPSVMDEDGDRIEMTWGELANFYQSEGDVARAERDAAIREREALKALVDKYENDDDLVKERSQLKARVAELEAAINSSAILTSSQAASGGGEGEPDPGSWQHEASEGILALEHMMHVFKEEARPSIQNRLEKLRRLVEVYRDHIVPFYRAHPQPRGWLTGEEREHIFLLAVEYETQAKHLEKPGTWGSGLPKPSKLRADAAMLRNLLARSSPPEVVKPTLNLAASPTYIDVSQHRDAEWIAALAAAGVAVKEVQ